MVMDVRIEGPGVRITVSMPRFLCQTTSIDFLSNQKFDFNKLFRDGVSYLPVTPSLPVVMCTV